MFNVTIIKLKDIIKLIMILITIYVLSRFVSNYISIKNFLDTSIIFKTNEFLKFGINSESNIIKNISNKDIPKENEKTEEVEENTNILAIKTILKIGSNAFNIKEMPKKIVQEEKIEQAENTTENSTVNQEEIAKTTTQVVTENPIAEKFNREYNGVKIKNETSFELTDDMLNSNNLDINKENIIIFHTHTCESYTESENYKYTATRKLQNNRFKLFGSKSRRRA